MVKAKKRRKAMIKIVYHRFLVISYYTKYTTSSSSLKEIDCVRQTNPFSDVLHPDGVLPPPVSP